MDSPPVQAHPPPHQPLIPTDFFMRVISNGYESE